MVECSVVLTYCQGREYSIFSSMNIRGFAEEITTFAPELANHTERIFATLPVALWNDEHFGDLKSTLSSLSSLIRKGSDCICYGLFCAMVFYSSSIHSLDYRSEEGRDYYILDHDSQVNLIKTSKSTVDSLEKGAAIIRNSVIPMYPQVRRELDCFINQVQGRRKRLERRSRFLIPSGLLNRLHGRIPECSLSMDELYSLRDDLDKMRFGLERLLRFTENMQTHFTRIFEVLSEETYLALPPGDILQSRRTCELCIRNIEGRARVLSVAFAFGLHGDENPTI